MRSPRILVAALAVALTATMATTSTSASAGVDDSLARASAPVSATPVAARTTADTDSRPVATGGRVELDGRQARAASAREEVTITSKLSRRKKPGEPYQFYLRGKVTGSGGPVAIQRATLCNTEKGYCNFKFYRKVWVNDDGVFDGLIAVPKTRRSWVWRARVGTVEGADWWQTCTTSGGRPCVIPEST